MGIKNNPGKSILKDFLCLYVLFPLKELVEKVSDTENSLTAENKLIIDACNYCCKGSQQKITTETSYKIDDKISNKNVSALIKSTGRSIIIG